MAEETEVKGLRDLANKLTKERDDLIEENIGLKKKVEQLEFQIREKRNAE